MLTATLGQPTAAEALTQSPQPLLRRLKVRETDDTIVLDGKVPTYYLKQLAQETVRPCLGQRRLLNQIVVI